MNDLLPTDPEQQKIETFAITVDIRNNILDVRQTVEHLQNMVNELHKQVTTRINAFEKQRKDDLYYWDNRFGEIIEQQTQEKANITRMLVYIQNELHQISCIKERIPSEEFVERANEQLAAMRASMNLPTAASARGASKSNK